MNVNKKRESKSIIAALCICLLFTGMVAGSKINRGEEESSVTSRELVVC
ncbi:MAG: hypothetical protein ABIJ00_12570 [Candidatus Eisenbacteria bacterium]